nr:transmembrane protease serine 13a [Misgurnus anguillicaudatus]
MADNDTKDPPPPYSSLEPQPPLMTYEQVIHDINNDVTHKTVPYYVEKEPVKLEAIIVTQHTVLQGKNKSQGGCSQKTKCLVGWLVVLLLLVGIGLAIGLGVHYGSKQNSGHQSECNGNDCSNGNYDDQNDGADDNDGDNHGGDSNQNDDDDHEDKNHIPDICSNSNLKCDGIKNCQQPSDETDCVRFGEGGVLQVKTAQEGQFLPVCYQGLDKSYADQICAQLGFRSSYSSSPVQGYTSAGLTLEPIADKLIQGLVNVSSSCPDEKAVSLQCTDCGKQQIASRIIGGSISNPGQWPWQVSLHFEGQHVCGGSLISPDFVVSAAHCFKGAMKNAVSWLVYPGAISQLNLPTAYLVKTITVHESYSSDTNDYDIALLKLTRPVDFSTTVQPICLPTFDQIFSGNQECWTSGFGTTTQGADHASSSLMGVKVNIIDTNLCNSTKVYGGAISNNMICAGDLNGGRDSCQGDSGGPLVCKAQNQQWYLSGITSWGAGCGEKNRPGVYSRLTSLQSWIYSTMQEEKP